MSLNYSRCHISAVTGILTVHVNTYYYYYYFITFINIFSYSVPPNIQENIFNNNAVIVIRELVNAFQSKSDSDVITYQRKQR